MPPKSTAQLATNLHEDAARLDSLDLYAPLDDEARTIIRGVAAQMKAWGYWLDFELQNERERRVTDIIQRLTATYTTTDQGTTVAS